MGATVSNANVKQGSNVDWVHSEKVIERRGDCRVGEWDKSMTEMIITYRNKNRFQNRT